MSTTTQEWKAGDKVGYNDRPEYRGLVFTVDRLAGNGRADIVSDGPVPGRGRRVRIPGAFVKLFTSPPEGNVIAYVPFPDKVEAGALVTVPDGYIKHKGGVPVTSSDLLVVVRVDYRKETASVYPLGGAGLNGYHWSVNAHLLDVIDPSRVKVSEA